MRLLKIHLLCGDFLRTAMHPYISHIAQPHTHLGVCGVSIQAQPLLRQLACQGSKKTTPQIAIEVLHLALGLGTVGLAQTHNETVMAGKI